MALHEQELTSLEETMEEDDDAMLSRIGVCLLCRQRLLDGYAFHSCAFPSRFLPLMVDGDCKTINCVVCFGLLQKSGYNFISQITQHVQDSGLDFSGFQLNISEPVDLMLREHAVWAHLRQRHTTTLPSSNGEDDAIKEALPSQNNIDSLQQSVSVPAKLVFRNFAIQRLKQHLTESGVMHKPSFFSSDVLSRPNWFDEDTEQVELLVNVDVVNASSLKDLERLVEAVKKHCEPWRWSQLLAPPKKPRRKWLPRKNEEKEEKSDDQKPEVAQISRITMKLLLQMLPDKIFLDEVINLDSELTDDVGRTKTSIRLGDVKVKRACPLILAGRYVKLCRELSQTPWILDGERKLDTSVEELIAVPIVTEMFGVDAKHNFVASGREDVDVRTLGLGRPFMLEITGYNRTLYSMLRHVIDQKIDENVDQPDSSVLSPDGTLNISSNDLSWLANRINKSTNARVFVRDLQIMPQSSANASLKLGEFEKTKRYRAVCWCSNGGLSTTRLRLLDSQIKNLQAPPLLENAASSLEWPPQESKHHPEFRRHLPYIQLDVGFTINQLTPIRVLHRRSLSTRPRQIHWVRLADFDIIFNQDAPYELQDFAVWMDVYPKEELFILEICCEAGTYVKELVHGDLGRTQPNFSSLLGYQVDLLALDVVAVDHDWPPRMPASLNPL